MVNEFDIWWDEQFLNDNLKESMEKVFWAGFNAGRIDMITDVAKWRVGTEKDNEVIN